MIFDQAVGILGGTGPAGRGLAGRLAAAGYTVVLGSRNADRAADAVAELERRWGPNVTKEITPATNEEAAANGTIVVLATAADAAVETAARCANGLAGKIVVSMANAMERFDREFRPVALAEGSVAVAVQNAAPGALVVASLHHVPAAALAALDRPLVGDVVVVADDEQAKQTVISLIGSLPELRAFDGGSLAHAGALESFCATILTVNLRNKGRVTLQLVPA